MYDVVLQLLAGDVALLQLFAKSGFVLTISVSFFEQEDRPMLTGVYVSPNSFFAPVHTYW